jgi:uncharacterized protein (DUF1501 family)
MVTRVTRRVFLRNSALAMVGAGSLPLWLARAENAVQGASRKRTLVAIFQRGAADGLNIVVPFGENAYYVVRPTIAIPRPDSGAQEDSCVDLDGFFGLHPSLAPLKSIYDERHLAIVHAAGSPDPTRSHFDAQDYMESGTPGLKGTTSGWLNRALLPGEGRLSPVRAIALGPALPRTLRGQNDAIAIGNVNDFQVRSAPAADAFESMYDRSGDTLLQGTGRETFDAIRLLQSFQKQTYQPTGGAEYPRTPLGNNLQQIARLIKADLGVKVAFADVGGWDHHVNEVGARPSQGILANALRGFGQGLAAFWKDLGDRMESVVVVTMSEFGRTAKENGNRGTDHGHANAMFVMGGNVRGGKVYGQWPGLENEQLYEGRDLALTTDFRDVLGEIVYKHLGNQDLHAVFPGYGLIPEKFRGFIQE